METKNNNCPCKRIRCESHGLCSLCMEHHHKSKRKPLTTCERIRIKESKNK